MLRAKINKERAKARAKKQAQKAHAKKQTQELLSKTAVDAEGNVFLVNSDQQATRDEFFRQAAKALTPRDVICLPPQESIYNSGEGQCNYFDPTPPRTGAIPGRHSVNMYDNYPPVYSSTSVIHDAFRQQNAAPNSYLEVLTCGNNVTAHQNVTQGRAIDAAHITCNDNPSTDTTGILIGVGGVIGVVAGLFGTLFCIHKCRRQQRRVNDTHLHEPLAMSPRRPAAG